MKDRKLKKLISCSVLFTVFSVTGAVAEEVYYGGGSIAAVDYEIDTIGDSGGLGLAYGRIGTEFFSNFAGEIRMGYGINTDTIAGLEGKAQIRNMYGLYLRGGLPLTDRITPYLVIGYARTKVRPITDLTVPGSREETDSDGSLGLGIDYALTTGFRVNVEYMQFLNKDVHSVSGVSAGFLKYF